MNVALQMLNNLSSPDEGDGNEIHPFCNSEVNVNPILQIKQPKKIIYETTWASST